MCHFGQGSAEGHRLPFPRVAPEVAPEAEAPSEAEHAGQARYRLVFRQDHEVASQRPDRHVGVVAKGSDRTAEFFGFLGRRTLGGFGHRVSSSPATGVCSAPICKG